MGANDQRQQRNEAMTPGAPRDDGLRFARDAVRERDDSYTGRISLNGSIILEATGNHSEHQAKANAEDDFIMFMRWWVDRFEEAMVAQADKEQEPFS